MHFDAVRNLFIVSLEYKVPLDQVDKYLHSHKSFLDDCYKKKIFIASGRKVPRTGGVIIASSADKEALESVLKDDPFNKHGIADYQITEFVPTMYDSDLQVIIKRDPEHKTAFQLKK